MRTSYSADNVDLKLWFEYQLKVILPDNLTLQKPPSSLSEILIYERCNLVCLS